MRCARRAAAGTVGRVHARRIRGRREQPARGARGRRDRRRAGHALQPAVHSRPERRGEDAPAERDRQRPRSARSALAVACVPAQLFVDELIAALQEGTVDRWRARYRAATRCCSTTCSSSPGKERTQEELFHLFNALYARRQAARVPSDRPPRELTGLEERLRSRFEGGLVVQMQAPDRALRERLYRAFSERPGRRADERDARAISRDAPRRACARSSARRNRIRRVGRSGSGPGDAAIHARASSSRTTAERRRAATMQAAADAFFLDREKIVWEWPDSSARLIEELR